MPRTLRKGNKCPGMAHNEALEISINYCWTNSVCHLRGGAAISTAIFETEIIR